MKITITKLLDLKSALQSIDQFKFDNQTSYTLMRDLDWVMDEMKSIEKTEKKYFEEAGSPETSNPKYNEFVNSWKEFLTTEIEVKNLRKIDYSKLNVGTDTDKKENPIPVRVLKCLIPVLNEESDTPS